MPALMRPACASLADAEHAGADALASEQPQCGHERILGCLPLVDSIARRVYGSLPPNTCLELHDLAQSGLLGLVSAGRCYDPETAVPFSIYARYRIEGEILDSLRRHDLAPRRLRRWQKQVSAARQELAGNLHREPTDEELCDRLMISLAEMRNRSLALSQTRPAASAAVEDTRQPDLASSPDAGPDHICERRQLREVLDRLIDSLAPRYQQVIRSHYCRHMTLKEIGGEMGVHESRVSQMHRSALEAMGRMLKESGISSPAHL
ncbi:MAG TPA: sigma-70 family RNA polymerase sigma factor [Bryobacteraceae bacterium]|nr:sigma-70 family RNA polymerase sigma factor [Bryobacteraceae bacterium]